MCVANRDTKDEMIINMSKLQLKGIQIIWDEPNTHHCIERLKTFVLFAQDYDQLSFIFGPASWCLVQEHFKLAGPYVQEVGNP